MNWREYVINILIGFDEWCNCILGGAPSDTISGRSARARNDGKLWGCTLCRFLDWLQPNHCDMALIHDKQGRHDEALDIE